MCKLTLGYGIEIEHTSLVLVLGNILKLSYQHGLDIGSWY
jgi:hypothetical protein